MEELLEQALASNAVPSLCGIKFTSRDLYDYGRCSTRFTPRFQMTFGRDEVRLQIIMYKMMYTECAN